MNAEAVMRERAIRENRVARVHFSVIRQRSNPREQGAMRVRFDQEADALYIRLVDTPVQESDEVRPGVVLDYDADNRVVGIELLRIQERLPAAELRQIVFEVA
jgi:uncharacterized protein YuzE